MGRPFICSLIAGCLLALYLNAWIGGLLFVFILFIYFVIQFIIDYYHGDTSDYLSLSDYQRLYSH